MKNDNVIFNQGSEYEEMSNFGKGSTARSKGSAKLQYMLLDCLNEYNRPVSRFNSRADHPLAVIPQPLCHLCIPYPWCIARYAHGFLICSFFRHLNII